MRELAEGYATSYDGTRIYYRSEGSGFPLVACNGILCSVGYWAYMRPFFRKRARMVVWDYRGHGSSEIPRHPSHMTIGAYCGDLKAVMDALSIEKTVLIGHSMGVQVILEFYRRYPERVMGLIPVCGTYGYPFTTFYDRPWTGKVLAPLLYSGEKHARLVERLLKPLLGTPVPIPLARATGSIHWYLCPREIMKDYFHHIATLDFATGFRAMQGMATHTAEDVLERVRVPTLIIAGEKDPFTPAWIAEKMWRTIPGAELLIIPQGTHTALVENPTLMHLRMEIFLRDHFQSQGYQVLRALGTRVHALTGKRGNGKPEARKATEEGKVRSRRSRPALRSVDRHHPPT